MPSRVLALLLALLLTWSGLGSVELLRTPAPAAQDSHQFVAQHGNPSESVAGSVEDHHLDDLPSQTQVDASAADLPGLHASSAWPALRAATASESARESPVAARPPCLAGPLRPPCSSPSLG